MLCVFFVKQKTAYEMRISDWSSDVCSSDLQFTPFWCDARRVQRSLKVNGFCVAEDEIFFPKGLRERRYRIAIAESRELPWFGHGKNGDRPKEQGQIGRASCRERVCQYV